MEVVGNYTISLVYGLHYCRTAEYTYTRNRNAGLSLSRTG